MPDKLPELFQTWENAAGPDPILFQAFQGGFSASAVSMRQRAVKVISDTKMDNKVKNALLTAIGALSDIPQE